MRLNVRFAGSGGQGVILASVLLSKAYGLGENYNIAQTQSYGPEARGGASKSEVIIDDSPIYHPHVKTPDVVLAMTQKAADKYYGDLHEDGILVLDTDLVPEPPAFKNIVRVPITKIAIEQVGKSLFANIVALGVLTKIIGLVDLETVKTAVSHRVPPHTIEANMKALQLGYDAVK